MQIPESELILNSRGAVYHLNMLPQELATNIITVGDPERVAQVSKHFDAIEVQNQHREFVWHTGRIGKKKITVLSTGIGTDNIDIVLNELDALVNINLQTRTVHKKLTSLNIIRIGTCGGLQSFINTDDFIVSTHALGIDNLLNFYQHQPNNEENNILQQFINHTQLTAQLAQPYITSAASSLLKHFTGNYHHGITVTCPGFYGPQGRMLRLALSNPQLVNSFITFSFGNHKIVNFEMETAGIYGLGRLLGHNCLSISTVVADRISRTFSKDAAAAMDKLILQTIQTIEIIETV